MNEPVKEVAEEMPEHQSSRGNEFRTISVKERRDMAAWLVRARSQMNATNADPDNEAFRDTLRKKQNRYYHEAGRLGISVEEAGYIWKNVVER